MYKVRIKEGGVFFRYNAINVIISGNAISLALKLDNGFKYLNFDFNNIEDIKITRTKEKK